MKVGKGGVRQKKRMKRRERKRTQLVVRWKMETTEGGVKGGVEEEKDESW